MRERESAFRIIDVGRGESKVEKDSIDADETASMGILEDVRVTVVYKFKTTRKLLQPPLGDGQVHRVPVKAEKAAPRKGLEHLLGMPSLPHGAIDEQTFMRGSRPTGRRDLLLRSFYKIPKYLVDQYGNVCRFRHRS
jgi:hypothetical protein